MNPLYQSPSGWWFGTLFIFHNIWDNPSHWQIFLRGVETTNQPCFCCFCWPTQLKRGRRWRRLQLNLGCNSVLKHRLTELEEMLQVGWDWMVAMGRFPNGITSQKWWIYPLVVIYSGFTHWKWWFSIAMLNYQRVIGFNDLQWYFSWGIMGISWYLTNIVI